MRYYLFALVKEMFHSVFCVSALIPVSKNFFSSWWLKIDFVIFTILSVFSGLPKLQGAYKP